MEVKVLRSGMLTTVQDLGRCGYRSAGVPLSGAADSFALRIANALVGNAENAAALEFTLVGPELEFSENAVVAIGGAECEGAPRWKPFVVRAGARVKLGGCIRGCRGYVAVAGGFEVTAVLGSASTFLRAGIGGHEGRALRDGDVLRIVAPPAAPSERKGGHPTIADIGRIDTAEHWKIDPRVLPLYSSAPTVRVLRGAHAGEFGDGLYTSEFKVSPHSDRMGVRLRGASLARLTADELISSAVAPGTIQVPADGQPIVLLADAQTIGGYPQIGHVIAVDLPLVAQLRPGDTIRFAPTDLENAQRLALVRDHTIAVLREGLAEKLGISSAATPRPRTPGEPPPPSG